MFAAARVVTLAVLAGCASYRAEPIDAARVQASLRTPDLPALRVAAAELRHPLLAPVVLDLRDGVSADEAAVMAVLLNPSLRAARARRAVARAQLVAAGILPNPELTGEGGIPIGTNPEGTTLGLSAGLAWEISSLVTRDAKMEAAKAEIGSVDLDIAWAEWQVAAAARAALFDCAALSAQLAVAEQANRVLAANERIVETAVDAHQKTEVDLAAARAAARAASETLAEVRGNLRRAEVALSRSVGVPAGEILPRSPATALPASIEAPAERDLLAGIEQRRLDLIALRRGYDSQEATLRAAVLGQFPRVTIGFSAGRDTGGVTAIGIPLAISLPIFDRNQGAIAIERATRRKLYEEYVQRVYEARADVSAALADIAAVQALLAAARATEKDLAHLVEVYDTALAGGRGDVVAYYLARGDLARKRIDILRLQQELAHDRVGLELAAGMILPVEARAEENKP